MSQISIIGPNAADFGYNSACPATPTALAVNATCTISVSFKPTYAGARVASLVINSNDPNTPALSIPLTGTGGLIPLTITASSPTFNWAPTGLPVVTPIVSGLVGTDTIASLGTITCTSTFKAGGLPGTYPTSCSGATSADYSFTYVAGTATVVPTKQPR